MRFQKSPSYFIQYAGLKTACALFRILPYNTAISVGRFSTAMAAKIMHKRFERNLCDIAQVFPDKSPQEIHQIALNSWKNMGQILAEFVKLSSFSENLAAFYDAKSEKWGYLNENGIVIISPQYDFASPLIIGT